MKFAASLPSYTLRIYTYVCGQPAQDHVEIATYDYDATPPPWVPRKGEFFRFRDHCPPGRSPDHREVKGYVEDIVTVHYGTRVVIEIYLKPPREWRAERRRTKPIGRRAIARHRRHSLSS